MNERRIRRAIEANRKAAERAKASGDMGLYWHHRREMLLAQADLWKLRREAA